MITIIDENNLVTEDGVELVAKDCDGFCLLCIDCYLDNDDCGDVQCCAAFRDDGREVIFVEKNPC